jgi:hypothetical protein
MRKVIFSFETSVRGGIQNFPDWCSHLYSECAAHTRCSFLWSITKIATGHVHDSKQTRVKTAYVHPATCNLAHWLIRHGSPTIHRWFALPQLLYRWWHESGKFWIPPRIYQSTRCDILQDLNLHQHRCQELRSHMSSWYWLVATFAVWKSWHIYD